MANNFSGRLYVTSFDWDLAVDTAGMAISSVDRQNRRLNRRIAECQNIKFFKLVDLTICKCRKQKAQAIRPCPLNV